MLYTSNPLESNCGFGVFRGPTALHSILSVVLILTALMMIGCGDSENKVGAAPGSPSPITSVSNAGSTNPTAAGNNYVFGNIIKFGAGGGSEVFRREGWSGTEQEATWTVGQSAKLVLSVPASDQGLTLRMRLGGLITAGLPIQPVEVYVNGIKVADWEVGPGAEYIAAIPNDITRRGGDLAIELKIPKAFSPKSAGMSEDPRVLGVSCSQLSITKDG